MSEINDQPLLLADHVLCLSSEENEYMELKFGQIFLTEEASEDEEEPNIKVLRNRVLWNGCTRKTDMDTLANYLVIDRRFMIGHRVKRLDVCGEIVSVSEVTTLYIHGTDDIITSEVPVNKLKPLTNCFYGVNVELAGWIGIITQVQRLFQAEFKDGTKCFLLFHEPESTRAKSRNPIHNLGYHFIPGIRNMSAPGIKTSFSENCLKEFAVWDPDNCETDSRTAVTKYANETATIVFGKIQRINVDWLGRICGTKEPVPDEIVYEDEIAMLKHFYIHPYRYFYKNGLCEYELGENDKIESRADWETSVKVAMKGVKPADESSPAKRMKSEIGPGTKLVVSKHIIRHIYQVKWDSKRKTESFYGSQLQRDTSRFPENFIPPYLFVKRKDDKGDQSKEYGVVVRRTKAGLAIQWVKVKHGKLCWCGAVAEELFLNLLAHPIYNRFTVGKHVYNKNQDSGAPDGFKYGTIIRVERHNYGKIIVHCCTDQSEKEMWPFELELITYDPLIPRTPASASDSESEDDSSSVEI